MSRGRFALDRARPTEVRKKPQFRASSAGSSLALAACMHRHWTLGVAALLLALTASGSAGADTRREAAAEELYWAFHACEEGLRAEATPQARVRLLEDYRFRRARAVHSDRAVLRTPRVRDYVVRDWLSRCDVSFPRQAEQGRKEAAQTEA